MRLRRLLIEQYGNFERLDLALAAEPGRINLVVAPNGAGKSVLRQAFHDLLFGYAPKSKMNFRYARGLSLHAEALTQAGDDLHFGWRHPGGRSFAADIHTSRFTTALGRVQPPQLEHLFALDTGRLRAGGEELAQGGDSLGLALLSGTGELLSAKAARADLAARRDALYAGTAKHGRPLARAAKAVDETRKGTLRAVQLPQQRANAVTGLVAEQARLDAARAEHAAMQEKASRLARIDRTRRFLQEHRAATEWLAGHPDAPVLAPGLADDLTKAREAYSLAAAKRADAQQASADDEAARAALVLDQPALDHLDALAGLRNALGRTEQAAGDVIKVAAERAGHLTAITAALRELGASVPIDQAASLLPRLADETTARQLIAQHASRADKQAADTDRVRQAQDALAALEMQSVPPPAPLEALQHLLAAIHADRNPIQHLADTAAAAADAQTQEAAALAAVPGWSGTAAALREQAVLAPAAFERLDGQRATAQAALREAEAECARVDAKRGAWRRALDDMRERPLPDQAAIAQARGARDRIWHLIYRLAFTDGKPAAADIEALIGPEALPLAFERLVREADALVDQRLLELPRVKEAERLTTELERSAPEWDAATAAVAHARVALADADAAFAAPCAALGLDRQASMADVRHALTQRSAAISAGLAAEQAHTRHRAVLDAQAAWTRQLRQHLPDAGDLPFAGLLAAADARLKRAADEAAQRIQHAADRRNAARMLADAQSSLQASDQALAEWRQRWSACLAALGRPADEPPAATEAVLQCLSGLATASTAAAALGQRVGDMQDEIAGFTATITALARHLGEPADPSLFATARRLIARHEAAQRQQALMEAAQTRLVRTGEALRRAAAGEREAQQGLNAIIAATGAADGDDAERRIAASRERARQEANRDSASAGLADHGEGLPLVALQADADDVSADEAAGLREETQRALTTAREASEAAAAKVRDLQQGLDEAAAATDLSELVLVQQAAAASFGHLLDDYLVISLAEHMLAQSVAKVEAESGSDGVSRISAAFARVTNGDYAIDGDEGPDGKTVLVAIEKNWPNERRALAQLSEGTRDQLYLALRIVAIEDHAASAAPLPFVADDILQTFDDARATAALHALLALSRHTQIIVLTHHPHVAALAGALPPGSVHFATL